MIEPSQNRTNDTYQVLASKAQPPKKTGKKIIGEVADKIFDEPPAPIGYYKKKDSLADEGHNGRKNNPGNTRYSYHPKNPQSNPLIEFKGRGLSLHASEPTTAKPRNLNHNHIRDTRSTKVQQNKQTTYKSDYRSEQSLRHYNQDLAQAAAKDDYKLAEEIFAQIKQHQLVPDIYSYNSLLLSYVNNHLVDKAEHIFKIMQEHGIPPNSVTFNTMLDLYVKMKNHPAISKILGLRKASRLPLDYITYNTLINYHVQIGDENGALKS